MTMEIIKNNEKQESVAVFAAQMERWCAARDVILNHSAEITEIKDNEDFEKVAEVRKSIAIELKELDDERKKITVELDKAKKVVMQQQKDLGANLELESARLARLLNDYATLQAAKKEAAERAKREAEAERDVMKEQAAEMGIDAVFAPVQATNVETAKSAYAKQVKVMKFEVVDSTKVPREFCIPDEKLIKAWMQYQKSLGKNAEDLQVPGLRFWSEIRVDNK